MPARYVVPRWVCVSATAQLSRRDRDRRAIRYHNSTSIVGRNNDNPSTSPFRGSGHYNHLSRSNLSRKHTDASDSEHLGDHHNRRRTHNDD